MKLIQHCVQHRAAVESTLRRKIGYVFDHKYLI